MSLEAIWLHAAPAKATKALWFAHAVAVPRTCTAMVLTDAHVHKQHWSYCLCFIYSPNRFGWTAEQIAVVPRLTADQKCGKGKTGVVTWAAGTDKKFGVFCFNASGAVYFLHCVLNVPACTQQITCGHDQCLCIFVLNTCSFGGNSEQLNSQSTKLRVLHRTDSPDPDRNTRYTSTQLNNQVSTFKTAENNNNPSANIFHSSFYSPGPDDTFSDDSLHLHHSDFLHPYSYRSFSPSHLETNRWQFFCSRLHFLCFLRLSEAAVRELYETFSRRYAPLSSFVVRLTWSCDCDVLLCQVFQNEAKFTFLISLFTPFCWESDFKCQWSWRGWEWRDGNL